MSGTKLRRPAGITGAILLALGVSGCSSATDSSPPSPTSQSSSASGGFPATDQGEILYQWEAQDGGRIFLGTTQADARVLVTGVAMSGQPSINDWHPDWSPDSERITFVAEDYTRKDIWIAAADGGNPTELYHSPPDLPWSEFPAWSPDGTQIVAVAYGQEPTVSVNSHSALVLIDVATGKAEQISVLADVHQVFAYPRWAPSGDALVVSIGRFTNDDTMWDGEAIAVLERTQDGWSQPTTITAFEDFASYPDWHPTQDLIVFATGDQGWFMYIADNNPEVNAAEPPQADLYTVRPDGTQLVPVTKGGPAEGVAGQPTWTPDGRIIFTSRPNPDVPPTPAIIDADGTNLTTIDLYASHPRQRPTP